MIDEHLTVIRLSKAIRSDVNKRIEVTPSVTLSHQSAAEESDGSGRVQFIISVRKPYRSDFVRG